MNAEVIGLVGTAIFILGVFSLIIEAFQDKEWEEFCVLVGSLLPLLGLVFVLI